MSCWVMPNCDGRKLLQRLNDVAAAPKVVIYTGEVSEAAAREGACGYAPKSDQPEALLEATAAVAMGKRHFSFADGPGAEGLDALTRRERELPASLADGSTNAQPADSLGVSINTIKFHLRNLYDGPALRNHVQAVAMFMPPTR